MVRRILGDRLRQTLAVRAVAPPLTTRLAAAGAATGFDKAAAIGMAKNGHSIIATGQVSSQVTPLREEAKALGLGNLRVERVDLTDPYDIAQAQSWDIDVLWNNAGMGEAGPVWEIPIDLVRKNFEVNVFLPLVVTQGVVRRWVSEKRGKVVFTSSMGGLAHPPDRGIKNRRWPSGAPFRGSVVEAPLLMLVSAPAPTPVFLIASPRHCRVAAVPLSVRR